VGIHDDLPGMDPRPTELDRYDLGDAVGNDRHLANNLPQIAKTLNELRPDTAPEETSRLLQWITGKYGAIITWTKKGIAYLQSALIKFALVKGRTAVLMAEADSKHAEADNTRAKADHLSAQAEAIRSETRIRENAASLENAERIFRLLKKVKAAGIDFGCSTDANGMLQIGYTKSPKSSEGEHSEDDDQN
jgi:hypothetical protein